MRASLFVPNAQQLQLSWKRSETYIDSRPLASRGTSVECTSTLLNRTSKVACGELSDEARGSRFRQLGWEVCACLVAHIPPPKSKELVRVDCLPLTPQSLSPGTLRRSTNKLRRGCDCRIGAHGAILFSPWLKSAIFTSYFPEFLPANRRNRRHLAAA